MTRQIKFRAYVKTGKHTNGVSFNAPTHMRYEVALNEKGEYTEIISEGTLEYDDVPVMQFTGLLDKNGKEIYEGDILKSKENDEIWRVDEIFPVHRHDHVTNIGYFDGKKYYPRDNPNAQYHNQDDWMSWPEMYEIIGNIYEHPHLLTNPKIWKRKQKHGR